VTRVRKVLLVERDLPAAGEVARQLAASGLEVEVVGDLQAAAARLAAQPYFAILSDVVNPRMGGPQLIQLARAQRPPVPVVLLTSSAHPRELVRAYRMGISDCLLKPLARADLDEVINHLLATAVEVQPAGGGLAPQETLAPPSFGAATDPLPAAPTLTGAPAPSHGPGPSARPPAAGDGSLAGHASPEASLRLRLERHIERDPLDLPIPPQLLQRLMEFQAEAEPPGDEVASVLQSSAPLSASLIRAARAADVSRASGAPVALHDALIRLGTDRALRTAVTTASHAMSQDLLRRHPEIVHALWLNHLVSARAAEHLARELLPSVTGTIHSWALFMEVGELVVLRAIETVSPQLLEPRADGRFPRETYQSVAELHGSAGRVALKRWQLHPIFAELAMAHPAEVLPARPTPNSQKLLLILRAARQLACSLLPDSGLTAPHALTKAERAALPELTDALLDRAGKQALDDAQQTVAHHERIPS
jgi:CheY-like chemotaxis protein